MGLDQYALVIDKETGTMENLLDQFGSNLFTRKTIAYWRKHNRLHGWMECLYKTKGGTEEFVSVELASSDLDRLETSVKTRTMPKTDGFFFGPDSYDDPFDDCYRDDLKFIVDARAIIKKGKKVFYYSSW